MDRSGLEVMQMCDLEVLRLKKLWADIDYNEALIRQTMESLMDKHLSSRDRKALTESLVRLEMQHDEIASKFPEEYW